MLSQPPLNKIAAMGVIMQLEPFTHDILSEDYGGPFEYTCSLSARLVLGHLGLAGSAPFLPFV